MNTNGNWPISREDFSWWRECQPASFYNRNDDLVRGLAFYCRDKGRLAAYQDRLVRFGASAGTDINEAAETSNRPNNLPSVQSFSRGRDYIQQVRYDSSYHAIGSMLYGTGVMSLFSTPADNVIAMAFLHLLSLNGEAGHACPFACTAGLIKAMNALGTAEQKQRHLPNLLETDYDKLHHAAQYLAESRGGSDVGANLTIAEQDPEREGKWLITGEKWFCSNVTAQVAVLTARPVGAIEGTRGLGLFLLPQRGPEGFANGIEIVRLKDKLGTRSLATAEILLKRVKAEALGPVDRGFKNMMKYLVNTSRLCNCLFASGAAQRACLTAELYADHRTAFGKRLSKFPLVRYMLGLMKAKSMAILSASLCLARMLDDLESASSDSTVTDRLYRVLLNLSKYRASVLARETVLAGIECLGGNGTIDNFSILPRLLRDCIVYETWEGAHNVLIAQTYRDFRKESTIGLTFDYLESAFRAATAPELDGVTFRALRLLESLRRRLMIELEADEPEPSWGFRTAAGVLADLFFLSRMCAEADWEAQAGLTDRQDSVKTFWDHIRSSARASRPLPNPI